MITITAELVPVTTGKIFAVESTVSHNNISTKLTNTIDKRNAGGNPFILGATPLDGKAKLASSVNYYIGTQLADSNGKFAVPYSITVWGYELASIALCFDTYNNQYPLSVTVNGVDYPCDNPLFSVSIEKTDKVEIVINNWNTPKYPLRIQEVTVSAIQIEQGDITNISRTIAYTGNEQLVSYGIISNIGSLKVIDSKFLIKEAIENSQLSRSSLCRIYLNNDNAIQEIGQFYTSEWEYDNDSREVDISLKDDLEKWQSINVEPVYYDFVHPKKQSWKDFYDYLVNIGTNNGFTFAPLDSTTNSLLTDTIVEYPYLDKAVLWSAFEDLCNAAQLYIYKNNLGQVVVIHKD